MPLETATYINQLDSANPLGSDPIASGDDHLRLIKSAVKATFPNITGAVTLTQAQINALPSDISTASTNATNSINALSSSTTASLALKADKATTVSAGTGLTGGGDLSANRSIALANTAVTPGSYGSSTKVARVTVDAQGRITAAEEISLPVPTVIADGEYSTNTTHSFAVSGNRPILLSMFYSGGQGALAYTKVQFNWGLGNTANARLVADATVNYQVAYTPNLVVTLTPSGSNTVQVRVDTQGTDGGYGAPSTFHVTAVQL